MHHGLRGMDAPDYYYYYYYYNNHLYSIKNVKTSFTSIPQWYMYL